MSGDALWCGHSATPTRDKKGNPVEGGNVAKMLDGRDKYGRPSFVEICLACTAEAAAKAEAAEAKAAEAGRA